jgi:hypothetical protein
MVRLLLRQRAAKIRMDVAESRLRDEQLGIPVEQQQGSMRWECQELMLAWAGLLETI